MPELGPVGGGSGVEANLAFTKFVFLCAPENDPALWARLRTVGGLVGRGFFNDFDTEGARDAQACETIQFLVRDASSPRTACAGPCVSQAPLAVQVSSRYRPRLQEVEEELRRRIGGTVPILSIDGALRGPRYSSAELQQHLQAHAPVRRSGRVSANAIVLPINKTAAWWAKSSFERHAYFYPHTPPGAAQPSAGHAQAASEGLGRLYKRMYHNPDGYGRPGEYDFIGYFECEDAALPMFDRVCSALRDPACNPEWSFVEEGPAWRGKRVMRF